MKRSSFDPLDDAGLRFTAGLLKRAVSNGQTLQLFAYYKEALIDPVLQENGQHLLGQAQMQHDSTAGSAARAVPRDPRPEAIPVPAYRNPAIALPQATSFAQWAETVCSLPKIQQLQITYSELVQRAATDPELANYLKRILSNHGSKSSEAKKQKVTPAADLAAFLEAAAWTPAVASSSAAGAGRVARK